ncbi:MAG TPA: hypothetical protein VM052_09750 [Candidatus Limnocylindrales bacterium]|nr:hypothetical protein [Candidatus Limnocylindrales bacterium]
MSKIVNATRTRIDQSETMRMALLSGASFVLGLIFIGLLVADQAAAGL